MAPPLENLLTIKNVAITCGVSVKTVGRWIAASELPAARLGNPWRIRPKDLQHFIQDRLKW